MSRNSRGLDSGLAGALLAACLGGCATQSGTVVLLPEQDGGNAALEVRQAERTVVLDKPYAAAALTSSGPQARTVTPAEVQVLFGPALAAQPNRRTLFTLYFVEQSDEFTTESKAIFESVFSRIASYPVPDIVVVGHTDRVGSDAANDALARQRADTVRAALIARGIAADSIVAVGRGEREPLVPTRDGVAEPRNRRVEIEVR